MPEPTETQQVRRDQGPITGKGAQRKEALLAAARRVFERKGFIDTRVSDIVKEAGVSHGTFYTYFDTKEAVFKAVSQAVIESMLISMGTPIPGADFHQRIRDSVRRFVEAYRPNAKMIGLMEQVGTYSQDLRELRLDVRETFVRRTQRGINRMIDAGLTDPDLDVEYTAESLGAMLEYVCYVWFSLDREFEENRLIDTLTAIWEKSLTATPGR
ncbi:TetR/AcrR family transcriptional regulator [Rhodococcus koreensis]